MQELCANCHRRAATMTWIGEGGALAYVHGGGVPWCEQCCLEAQLAYAKARAAAIPRLEHELTRVRTTR